MESPSSHVLRVFTPVKRSCRSGGQKGKAHANGQRWPQWVSEQRWTHACITQGAQHAGPRLQYIASTGGILQAHSRCFFLHQLMHQVQQPIDPSHMARGMVPKGGRYANQYAELYRSPRHVYATTGTYVTRRQSIPANAVHTLWDRSGTVVELGKYDQYWVKVDTDQTTASAFGTTHRSSFYASPRLDRGGTDRRSTGTSRSAVINPTSYTG